MSKFVTPQKSKIAKKYISRTHLSLQKSATMNCHVFVDTFGKTTSLYILVLSRNIVFRLAECPTRNIVFEAFHLFRVLVIIMIDLDCEELWMSALVF